MTIRTTLATALLVIISLLSLTACGPLSANTASAASPSSAGAGPLPIDDPNAPVASASTCHMGSDKGQPLPDPDCAPGAVNPNVTQSNIATTICKSGWTATIRPPASYTDRLKREQIAAYGEQRHPIG